MFEAADLPPDCSTRLRLEGKEYPRTCRVHGLGPCVPMSEPEAPVQTSTASPRVVAGLPCIVTSYALSVAYGPYPPARAEELAEELSANGWGGESWVAVSIGRLPGEPPPAPSPPSLEEQKQQLYRVLEHRQFPTTNPCPNCGSLEPGSHTCGDEPVWKD